MAILVFILIGPSVLRFERPRSYVLGETDSLIPAATSERMPKDLGMGRKEARSLREGLFGGMSKREALRKSQEEMRAKYSHPFYWGAFVMLGE